MNRFLLAVFFVFITYFGASAQNIDVEGIDRVLRKAELGEVLGSSDLEVVDSFIKEAFEELLMVENHNEAVEVRTIITAKIVDKPESQYMRRFSSAVLSEAGKLYEILQSSKAGGQGLMVSEEMVDSLAENLLILLWRFPQIGNVDIAADYIVSDNIYLRYWALKNVTKEEVLSKLTASPATYSKQLDKLLSAANQGLAETDNIDTLILIAMLGHKLPGEEANELFAGVVEKRLDDYRNWEVSKEILDIKLLRMLGAEIENGSVGMSEQEAAIDFSQFYSFVMQRYIMARDYLSLSSVQGLESVMVEIEHNEISKLLETPQSSIKNAIEQDNLEALQREHDILLGGGGRGGVFASKYGVIYNSPDGSTPEKLDLPGKYRNMIDEQNAEAGEQ
jgi:hypothetical protein